MNRTNALNRTHGLRKRPTRRVLSWQICSSCPKVLPFLQYSRGDIGTVRKKRKTYGRFLGMIFFEGVWQAVVLARQRLAMRKIQKKRKNAKKSVKYFPRNPHFAAKRARFTPHFDKPTCKLLPLCGLSSFLFWTKCLETL